MRPSCTILGGANGSGKSSIYDTLRPVGVFVNADVLARQFNPEHPDAAALAAGRRVLGWLAELLHGKADFVFETTMSGRQPLDLMRRAHAAGYVVRLIFVVLQSADLHVDRVAQRVSRGGHDIETSIILRRFQSALTRLPEALKLADETVVVDNTSRKPAVLLRIANGIVVASHLDPAVPIEMRLAYAVAEAFGVDEQTVLGS